MKLPFSITQLTGYEYRGSAHSRFAEKRSPTGTEWHLYHASPFFLAGAF